MRKVIHALGKGKETARLPTWDKLEDFVVWAEDKLPDEEMEFEEAVQLVIEQTVKAVLKNIAN